MDTYGFYPLNSRFPLFVSLAQTRERRPLRKGERQSGYHSVSFATCSQFTNRLLLHRVRHCYAAPSVESPICVAVRKQLEHLRLGNGRPLAAPTEDEQYGRSPIVSALQISPCSPKGKRESQEGRNRRCLPFWFPRRNRRRSPRLEGEKLTLNKRHRTQNEQRQCQRNRTQRRAEHNDRR